MDELPNCDVTKWEDEGGKGYGRGLKSSSTVRRSQKIMCILDELRGNHKFISCKDLRIN